MSSKRLDHGCPTTVSGRAAQSWDLLSNLGICLLALALREPLALTAVADL